MKDWKLCSLLFETTRDYKSNLQTLLYLIEKTPQKSLIVAPEVCLTGFDYENFAGE
jgi:predicted amidohydrolase